MGKYSLSVNCEIATHSPAQTFFLSQPELLAGKRYSEDIDTYSFGVVLFEIAAARLPYARERQAYKESGGKGVNMKMMREISKGLRKPELAGEPGCRRFRVGGSFKKCRSSFLACRVHVALLLIAQPSLLLLSISNSNQALREV